MGYCFIGFKHLLESHGAQFNKTLDEPQLEAFNIFGLSFFKTLMMMMGEYEHSQVMVKPILDQQPATIYYPELTFIFYIAFAFFVPISLMNLMVSFLPSIKMKLPVNIACDGVASSALIALKWLHQTKNIHSIVTVFEMLYNDKLNLVAIHNIA